MPLYNAFKRDVMLGQYNLSSDTIKVALMSASYAPDIDAHTHFHHVSGAEVSQFGATGYTAGGATLANKTVTVDNTDDEGVFDADDVTFASSTITARYAIFYKSTGTASTSGLIAYVDFGSNQSSSNGNFSLQFNSEGIINLN